MRVLVGTFNSLRSLDTLLSGSAQLGPGCSGWTCWHWWGYPTVSDLSTPFCTAQRSFALAAVGGRAGTGGDIQQSQISARPLVQLSTALRWLQWVDVLALVGDASDNIPGVRGVGPKSALPLLQQYGTLDAVLDAAGSIEKKVGYLRSESITWRH